MKYSMFDIVSPPLQVDLINGKATSGLGERLKSPAKYLIRNFRLAKEFLYDFNRYRKFSSTVRRGDNKEKLQALITMAYHSIEKGLSLPAPRPGFGMSHVNTLLLRLRGYINKYGPDCHCLAAFNALTAYQRFNKANGVLNEEFDISLKELEGFISQFNHCGIQSGTKCIDKTTFLENAQCDLSGFFEYRSSVRQYSNKKVDISYIRNAVRMAQKTPCVCNRQSWKVRALTNQKNVKDALDIQGGAGGFSEYVGTVLVVSSDISAFQSTGERYQCWIEGGLFAMSLILALHSLGLVTCCLNWSKNKDTDVIFKKRFNISQSESIVMLISAGHPVELFEVAASWRKPIEDVLVVDSHS